MGSDFLRFANCWEKGLKGGKFVKEGRPLFIQYLVESKLEGSECLYSSSYLCAFPKTHNLNQKSFKSHDHEFESISSLKRLFI